MFDIVLGPGGRDAWLSQNMGRVQFRHEWSRVVFGAAAAITASKRAFTYKIGDTNSAALNPITAQATLTDTSMKDETRFNWSGSITHMSAAPMRFAPGGTGGVATTAQVLAPLAFQSVMSLFTIHLQINGDNVIEETMEALPEGKGPDGMTTAGAVFYPTNGSPVWANLRPIAKPIPIEQAKTTCVVEIKPETNGGATYTPAAGTDLSIMIDLYGVSGA